MALICWGLGLQPYRTLNRLCVTSKSVHAHSGCLWVYLYMDPPQGEDQPQDLTSGVFVYGRSHPDGSEDTPPMSTMNFDDLLGRTFFLLWMRIWRERELLFLIISIPSVKIKFQEKIN